MVLKMSANYIYVNPVKQLRGEIYLPGDKSISHRALILTSIAKGKSLIKQGDAKGQGLSGYP